MRPLFFLLFILAVPAAAQFTYTQDQSIPVEVNGKTLRNAWAGGLNSPQINTLDLNADGQADLVIFDKTAGKIVTFLAVNSQYRYAPDYENLFPTEVSTFVLLRDYNCDGKKDLFTFGQIGVLVFQNVTQAGKPLSWKKLSFYNANTRLKSDVLLTLGFSGKINLLPGTNDLPHFADMDGDGDLDVLNMRFVNPSTAEYHKNFSMERYGRCDSLELERQTQNWGGFEECNCGKIAFGKTCAQLGGREERTEHTGGKALLALDLDNDGDKDLMFSEENCSRIYYIENQGTAAAPVLNNFTLAPPTDPVGILFYPAPYLEDVDFDGKPDLLSAPNLGNRTQLSINFKESLWYYTNTGSTQVPNFTFVKNNFLQDEMIDEGDGAAPAFTDIDNDGDLDLFIGKYIGDNLRGSVSFYENTGNRSAAAFKLITNDYLSLSGLGFYNIKPQFADLDGNGGIDLIFTATQQQNGRTNLYYVASSSNTSSSFNGRQVQAISFNIDFNENVTLVDVDQDGKLDLLVGQSTGALEYWRNTGSGNTFELINNAYLGLDESITRQNLSVSVGDLDGDSHEDLVAGDQTGQVLVFSDFRSALSGTQPFTDLVYNSISKTYSKKNLGRRLRPVIVNLLGTDKPEIIIGGTQGGLTVLKNDNGRVLSDRPVVQLFPNPLTSNELLSIKADRAVTMDVFTVLGKRLGASALVPSNEIVDYSLQGFSPGVYIARFTAGAKSTALRFVIY
ncbi:MAG: T9SS type A sorting domain-containing protein [Cyclobacteriaceae bacterium]|nr:T9SS type A sorting domain-containing protein [Cyclobacteriaceae bacterium]